MEDCQKIATPMATSCYLDADEKGTSVEQTKYRGLIGSLIYLTATRPNIVYRVCLCTRYQANLQESHYMAANKILKYLKRTTEVLVYGILVKCL